MIRLMLRADLPAVTAVYESAFPAGERKPVEWIAGALGRADYRWLVEVGPSDAAVGAVRGFACVFDSDEFSLIEYLAVEPAGRSSGIGSQLVRAAMGKATIVEVETDGPDADRRRVFYERLGFRRLMELPYTCPLPGAPPMELMVAGDAGGVGRWVDVIYDRVYGTRASLK